MRRLMPLSMRGNMIEIKIDTDRMQRSLSQVASRIDDRKATNKAVSVELYGWVVRNFKAQGGLTESRSWAPLKPATIKAKAKHGYRMILQNTGALRQSFVPFSSNDEAGVGAAQMVGKDRPTDLAAIHQYGTEHIPARPMLPSRRQALEIAIKVYDYHISRAVKGAT